MNFGLTRVDASFSTLVIFTLVTLLPQNALAFETKLASSKQQALQIPVRLSSSGVGTNNLRPLASSVPAQPVIEIQRDIRRPVAATSLPQLPLSENATRPSEPVPVPVPVVVASGIILAMQGEASYYSRAGCLGCSPALRMANGQPLDDNALTMAIGADKKHLVGRSARVTNLATGQSVTVRITDTGGFYQAKYGHRVADLTIASKNAIGMKGGVGQVRVEVF